MSNEGIGMVLVAVAILVKFEFGKIFSLGMIRFIFYLAFAEGSGA